MNNILLIILLLILLYIFIRLVTYIYRQIRARQFAMIPLYLPARSSATTPQLIPRVIYQTMKDSKVPISMQQAAATWVRLNPEYEYRFYTDDMCRDFIAKNFHQSVLYAYDKLVPGAFKADLWRYAILYKYGGVYADVDMVAEVPLRTIINPDDTFISVRDTDYSAIFNAFICCTPEHPFIKSVINHIVTASANNFYGRNSLHPTGPLAFGEAIARVLEKNAYYVFDLNDQTINGHHFKLLEHPYNSREIRDTNGRRCINTKYDQYYQDMANAGVEQSYHNKWVARNIYKENPIVFKP